MKHVSEELARLSRGRICSRNDDRQSGRIRATPSASTTDESQFVSPPPSPLRAQPYPQQRRSLTNKTNKPTAATAMYKYSTNLSTESTASGHCQT
jgi:hypothetical protein